MPLDKYELMDEIEDIQIEVDGMGFMGSNENDLWRREMIADYIVKNFIKIN